jgi:hypothetical protein
MSPEWVTAELPAVSSSPAVTVLEKGDFVSFYFGLLLISVQVFVSKFK